MLRSQSLVCHKKMSKIFFKTDLPGFDSSNSTMSVDYQFKAPNYFEPDKGYVSLGLGRMKIKI